MKNLKVIWPTVIAITLALTLRSCHDNQVEKNMDKIDFNSKIPNVSEQIIDIDEIELPNIVIVKDGNTYTQKIEEESVKTR